MRTLLISLMVALLTIAGVPVMADPPHWAPAHGRRAHKGHGHETYRPKRHVRVIRYNERIYRGKDGRYYCRRSDGTMGLVVGAAVGGLIGNRLSRGDSETIGTLIGAGAGALLGQAIDRGTLHCD